MNLLSRLEEILLLAIWKLGDKAYGVTIKRQIEEDTATKWMSGAIYAPLGRLLKNGYVNSAKGEATTERGGRHKIYYRLTDEGLKRLAAVQELNNTIWIDVPDLKKEKHA